MDRVMDRAMVAELVERVAAFDAASPDRDEVAAVATAVARLRRWLDGRDAAVAGALARVASFPEKTLADATRDGFRDAQRSLDRSATLQAAPAFAAALDAGDVGAGHVDVLTRALRGLEPHQRPVLLADTERLARIAAHTDPAEFASRVKTTVEQLRTDEGIERFERQRRATRLRSWVDRTDGTWRFSGVFDPLTGQQLVARIQAMREQLFRDARPDTCPSDPVECDQHLAGLALVALTRGGGAAMLRPELVGVLDGSTPPVAGGPPAEWAIPVELPAPVVARLAGRADVHGIVLWNGFVLHAPGIVDLGRSTRVANRAQRRVLRALYGTCAVPDCAARFDDCRIHHVVWWRHGGRTDLDNLLPLCSLHHHAVHDDGWQLTLAADRTLTITLPDGRVLATGPPGRRRRAA